MVLGASIFLIGAAFMVWHAWQAQLDQQAELGRQVLHFDTIDLSKEGTISWSVPTDKWQYKEGEARLSLVVNRVPNLSLPRRDGSTLRIRITAKGILHDGATNDRLIRDWYYTTDEPFTNEPKLWESGGPDSEEFGLGGIAIHPFERLVIGIQVLTPYAALQEAKPRLKLAAKYDYAIDEHLPFMRFLGHIAFGLSVIAILILFRHGWYRCANYSNPPT